jgi:putative membrane protein
MKRLGVLLIALATVLTIACNNNTRTATNEANQPTVGTSGVGDSNTLSAGDKHFVQDLWADGDAEVQLGKLAAERGASADVKRFGEMMVQDHMKAGEQLKQIAARYNIEPDPKMADNHKDAMDKLSKLRGAEFDREFINRMIDDHQDAVNDLQGRVDYNGSTTERITKGTTGSDRNTNVKPEKANNHAEAELNEWAANTLPTVQHHLDEAKMIKDKLENTRRNTTARAK